MNIALSKDVSLEKGLGAPKGLPTLDWCWAPGQVADDAWQQWAGGVHAWLSSQGVAMVDAVVLLPQIALLNVARRAWARSVGGWQPRFETVGTLLDRLPPEPSDSGVPPTLTLDACVDQLLVAARLKADAGGRDWARRDPDGFDFAVTRMMEVAHQWIKAAMSLGPQAQEGLSARVDDWMQEALSPWAHDDQPDPRARERVLTAMALSWGAQALPALMANRWPLFEHRPAAWVALTPGPTLVPGTDSQLMVSMLLQGQAAGVPALWSRAMLGAATMRPAQRPQLAVGVDGEDEAQQTAAHVLDLIERQRAATTPQPVALIATDRVLTRRVRALLAPLEAQGSLAISDESGWTLSTTRAASVITRLLAAAQPRASTDDVLDWLSSGWVQAPGGAQALAELEALWRERGTLSPWSELKARPQPGGANPGQARAQSLARAQALQGWAQQTLAPLGAWALQSQGALSDALQALRAALNASGAWDRLTVDDAGKAVLTALRLDEAGPATSPLIDVLWRQVSAGTRLRLRELARWVDQTLESATFMPEPSGHVPDLVITPLTRAVLRPFAAVVLPGADEVQLGARGADGWLSAPHAETLGLSTPAVQQMGQWEAFSVLMTHPQVLALRRLVREGEPVSASPWLIRWSLAGGWPLGQDEWPSPAPCRLPQAWPLRVPRRPQPALPSRLPQDTVADPLWPAQVSASAYDRLRACPYRFFALSLLGLRALDELEEGLERQDHGTWLHAVLKRFHEGRPAELAPPDPATDLARWMAVAQVVAQEHGFTTAEQSAYFLPYQATLERLAGHYVQWLRGHESAGWRVVHMEDTQTLVLRLFDDGATVKLQGQLDRVDEAGDAQGQHRLVMDYKTGSASALKAKVQSPNEDTQLAFYALLADDPAHAVDLQAIYLHLDDRACTALPHPDVGQSAQALREGLTADFQRLWQGHAMPALGEGSVCDYCDARGLCRKDHWAAEAKP